MGRNDDPGAGAPTHVSRRMLLLAGATLPLAPVLAAGPDSGALLEADIANVEGVRAAKRLQHAWSHYAEAGDFAAMADLFARNGRLIMPPVDVTGRAAILEHLKRSMGGLARADGLNVRLMLSPVVTVEPGGTIAKGRWHEMTLTGVYGASADWSGGIHENDYVLEDGVWKIGTLHYYPQYAGPYATGWRTIAPTTPLTPFHYSPDGAGRPVPLAPLPRRNARTAPALLAARAQALADESAVQNLQAAYGFYTDRKMWDDVADLFAPDGVLEVEGSGARIGQDHIRRGLARFGPLAPGQLNDHIQFVPVVTVASDGRTAKLRAFELQVLATHGGKASWGLAIVDSDFRKDEGVWKIARMRKAPRFTADYDTGWARDLNPPLAPSTDFPPDKAVPLASNYPQHKGPKVSFAHPVKGAKPSPAPLAGGSEQGARAALAIAKAHDGAENIATAYGYYIDDFKWDDTADLFAIDGWKELSYVGTYIGRERIRESMVGRYGRGGRSPSSLAIHQKVQPYVTVAPDGQSARIRLKLFQVGASPNNPPNFIDGIYEEQVKLENGIWKIHGMDLDYVVLSDYKGGWSKVQAGGSARFAPAPGSIKLPPDGPLRGAVFPPFPEIGPVGFHFVNPVSGRKPAILLPLSDGHFA